MRRTFSIISHILIAIVAVMTAVYNVEMKEEAAQKLNEAVKTVEDKEKKALEDM